MLGQILPFLVYASREDFCKRVASFFAVNSFEYREIVRAHDFVETIFEGDFRDDGSPYIEHLRGTALIVLYFGMTDYEVIVAALLHDVLENHPEKCSPKKIKKEFGARVAFLVKYVTKPTEFEYPIKEERDHAYHCRFCFATIEEILLKLGDRLHNVLTLGACPPDKRRRTIRDTWRYYMPFAEEWGILHEELKDALIKAKKIKYRPLRQRPQGNTWNSLRSYKIVAETTRYLPILAPRLENGKDYFSISLALRR